jgi:MSHA pilin protein MshD
MLNEIQNKAFDQHSDMAGGLIRCGEYSIECSTTMGKESESRATFNDVDDYNDLTYLTGNIENSQGQVLSLYTGYAMKVKVCNDADYSGPNCDGALDNNISTAKLIIVTVTTPTGFDIIFSTYRANF